VPLIDNFPIVQLSARPLKRVVTLLLVSLNMKNSKSAGLVPGLLILVATSGCERDMRIKIDGKNPLTFTFSGNDNLIFLSLGEIHNNKPSLLGAPELWKIQPSGNKPKVYDLLSITYGVVPSGFIQVALLKGPRRHR